MKACRAIAASACLTAILGELSVGSAIADEGTTTSDKTAYSLFNPTPDKALRSFATDRPTKSNSPYTVDAGRLQYETDFFNYTSSNFGGQKTRLYQAFDPVWKLGITNSTDVEIQFNGYQRATIRDAVTNAVLDRGGGFGDVILRTKVNLLGNDGGPVALSLFPFIKLPSGRNVISNGVVEGGFIVPLRVALNNDYGVIIMPEVDVFKNALSMSRHANIANLINFNGPVPGIDGLAAYVEFASSVSMDRMTPSIYTFDTALSYNITPTVQVDVGANFGLNRAAPKVQLYTGIAQRF